MIKEFTFRWVDPVSAKSVEFKADNEEEFCAAAIDAAIDYRVASMIKLDCACQYPVAQLEIRHGSPENNWQGMRFAWNCPPMQLLQLGLYHEDDAGKHQSDVERIKSLSHSWWKSIVRWTTSYSRHTKVDRDSRRHQTTDAPD